MSSVKASLREESDLSMEGTIFQRKWYAAIGNQRSLPFYEDVVLGGLGRLSDHLIVIEGSHPEAFRILRAGNHARDWLGSAADRPMVAELSPDCGLPLTEVLSQALEMTKPVCSHARRVRDGAVITYEVVAFPIASRWGPPLLAVCVNERGTRYSLVESIFESTHEGILTLTVMRDARGQPVDFQIVAVNNGATRMLGASIDALRWRRLSEIKTDLDCEFMRTQLLEAVSVRDRRQFEMVVTKADQKTYLSVGVGAVGDLVSVTLTDIGDVKRREESFRLLFEGNPVPMFVHDPVTLKFLAVNDAAVRHYGYSRETFAQMTLEDLWPVHERDARRALVAARPANYQSDTAVRHIKADGTEIQIIIYGREVPYGAAPGVLVAIVDVTERRQAEARVSYLAHHDALTGLTNRMLFHDRLNDALKNYRPEGGELAIHFIDLDHFKGVNDTLGHPVGDVLLQSVARRLTNVLSDRETVARLGGDEFAVIQFASEGQRSAETLAHRIIHDLSEPYSIDGNEIVIGASVGIAMAPADGEDPDTLLRNADMALYRAKAEGRGTFHFFEAGMDRKAQQRRLLELDLRKAFANGEFELYYQPLINVRSNTVSACEALLRWKHPERGMVSPADFIPLAEDIGLIVPLGEWVLRQACAEAASWPNDICVAVNLSPMQFKGRNVVQAVVSALAHSGLAPHRLELEITESVLLKESEFNIATLHQLRSLGVHIAMDDFGTGYSSLSYLRSFPFDKIKIDRSFVSEMNDRADCIAIVRAVAGIGASLGITTTAEGVETQGQFEQLRAEGCTEVQGFLFSPPVPAAKLGAFVREQSWNTAAA